MKVSSTSQQNSSVRHWYKVVRYELTAYGSESQESDPKHFGQNQESVRIHVCLGIRSSYICNEHTIQLLQVTQMRIWQPREDGYENKASIHCNVTKDYEDWRHQWAQYKYLWTWKMILMSPCPLFSNEGTTPVIWAVSSNLGWMPIFVSLFNDCHESELLFGRLI